MRVLARVMCVLSLIVCAGVGIVSLAAPTGTAGSIGLTFDGAAGRAEFITVYGGFYLGIAVYLLVALLQPRFLESALAFLAFAASGAMLARLGAWYWLSPEGSITQRLLISEVVWAASGWIGWAAAWFSRVSRPEARAR